MEKLSPEDAACQFLELVEEAVAAQTLPELMEELLPGLARMLEVPGAFLYLDEPRRGKPLFYQFGLQEDVIPHVEGLCSQACRQVGREAEAFSIPAGLVSLPAASLTVSPVCREEKLIGLLGLLEPEERPASRALPVERYLSLFSNAIPNLVERWELEHRTRYLSTYLTISSMVSQCLDLQELVEAVLYCCIDAVGAEEASILLLDDEKSQFRFYNVAGPSKPVLEKATFPAGQGIAGAVLNSQQSEVINDVQHDPRFYGKIDDKSGVVTRNMIAIPLSAAGEKIGVMEVLNKAGGGLFTDEERLLLDSIAEEIAFAVRNARLFEYVVNSYCKQRRGEMTCKGCKRPLGSWTPCVKYRERELSV
jgi:hypothetical protein